MSDQTTKQPQDKQSLHPINKLMIAADAVFYGPGAHQLLLLIHETRSVRQASERMGISYSKAWKILNNIADQIDCSIVARQHGGKGGGQAYLTQKGEEFVATYCRYVEACELAIQSLFHQHFDPICTSGPSDTTSSNEQHT